MRLFFLLIFVALSFSTALNAAAIEQSKGISYTVHIEADSGNIVEEALQKKSILLSKDASPLLTYEKLHHRVEKEKISFKKILSAYGYHDAEIISRLDKVKTPNLITFTINLKKRYKFKEIKILNADTEKKITGIDFSSLPIIKKDMAYLASDILESERLILTHLGTKGHPQAQVRDRFVLADPNSKKIDVLWMIEPDATVYFGSVTLTGRLKSKPEWVESKLPWKNGDIFNHDLFTELKKKLLQTGVFSSVSITANFEAIQNNQVPIILKVSENKRRLVGGGANYSTSEGLGGRAFWEHRNLFNGGEKLRVTTNFSKLKKGAGATYTIPDFYKLDQDLQFKTEINQIQFPSRKSNNIFASTLLRYKLGENSNYFFGGEANFIQQIKPKRENFKLLGLPLGLYLDHSNDKLDPQSGWRFHVTSTPYASHQRRFSSNHKKQVNFFAKIEAKPSAYIPLNKKETLSFATRLRYGSFLGNSHSGVPREKRFYGGGGQSIRGYSFETLGPIHKNRPTGGLSAFEVAAEFRWRITKSLGLVPFIEAGNVFKSYIPTFKKPLLFSAGVGIRYFIESIGPLRLDIAFPLHRRKFSKKQHRNKKSSARRRTFKRHTLDQRFQVYISIGQTF